MSRYKRDGLNSQANPLITLAILCYNQEQFISQAIEAAFAQSYSPLEIIISDDASQDGSADIIRELAAAYLGPHAITLNFNKRNEGVASHVNRLFALAQGELLVLAAGDDLSHRERVARVVGAWQTLMPQPWALHSSARLINPSGQLIGSYCGRIHGWENNVEKLVSHYRGALLLGATTAYDTRLQNYFGPLHNELLVEDVPLTVRAAMLGRVAYLDEELVDYRVGVHGWLPYGGDATTFDKFRELRVFKIRTDEGIADQIVADAVRFGNREFIQVAMARKIETEYAALVASSGRPQLRRLISTIRAARRLFPSLLLVVLLCSRTTARIYFEFSRRFRSSRDARVFRQTAANSGDRMEEQNSTHG